MVTIGIPVYNCQAWIAASIDSALAQTYQDKEIIVVDDGSTDETSAICRSYGGRVRYLRQDNRGGNRARNFIIEEARGDWIQFLDADDYLLPDKIAYQLNSPAVNSDTEIIISPVTYECWYDDKITSSFIQRIEHTGDLRMAWLFWELPQVNGWLWKRSVFQKIGGWDETVQVNQDVEIFLRAVLAELSSSILIESLSVWRIWSKQSVCHKNPVKTLLGIGELTDAFQTRMQSLGKWNIHWQRLADQQRLRVARSVAATDLQAATKFYRQHQLPFWSTVFPGPYRSVSYLYQLALFLIGFERSESLARAYRNLLKRSTVS